MYPLPARRNHPGRLFHPVPQPGDVFEQAARRVRETKVLVHLNHVAHVGQTGGLLQKAMSATCQNSVIPASRTTSGCT